MLVSFEEIIDSLPGEILVSLIIVFLVFIFSLIIYIKIKKADPYAKPKGILNVVELGVEGIDNLVKTQMGWRYKKMGGYFLAIAIFVFTSFIFGLTGLPSPMSYYMVPFTLALFTFILIHFTRAKTRKWGYFHAFIEPFAPFLPINLISMWAPLISLSFRMFCNSLAGWAIMSIVYYSLQSLSTSIFFFLPVGLNSILIAPWIASVLHLYFDLFSSAIQTLVFIMLSMIFIAQEGPTDEEPEAVQKAA